MKGRGRIVGVRRVATWAGVVVCVLIAAAWMVNLWWDFGYLGVRAGGHNWAAWVENGSVVGVCAGGIGAWDEPSFNPRYGPMVWWWEYERLFPSYAILWVPLWMPFVLVGIPTAWLWWRDRRPRAGHCSCGYDLAGLAPGAPCPECGKADP